MLVDVQWYLFVVLICITLMVDVVEHVLNLMVIFSAGQAHEVLRTRTRNMATFQRSILVACNAQTPF